MNEGCKDCVYIKDFESRLQKMEGTVLTHDKKLNDTDVRMSKIETKVDDMKEDIKEIKEHQSKMMMWIIGIMGTSIVSLLVLVINILAK